MATFLKKLATLGTFVAVIASFAVSPAAHAQSYNTPDVSSASVSPNPFDPYTQSATIEYFVDAASNVRVDILDPNNNIIRTLSNEYQNAGWHTIIWDGADYTGYNEWAPEGTYTYEITSWITSGFTDTERGSIYVDYDNTPTPGNNPQISNISIPNEFEINISQPWIGFYLDGQGQVTITVRDNYNNFIRTVADQYLYTGDQSFLWDTTDYNGNQVGPGNYEIEIQVANNNNVVTDREYWTITGKYRDDTQYRPEISDVYISPSTFNPEREDTQIRFYIDEQADVLVEIINEYNGRSIRFIEDVTRQPGTHYVYWNGRDDSGRTVAEDTYDVRIYARNNDGSDEETREVEVDYEGIIRPYPPTPRPYPPTPGPTPNPGCAGFRDVPYGTELCDAAEFVRENGIFGGYPDGTFRPEQPINRAEVTKVILEGFQINIMPPTGTQVGFTDVDPFAWYMPYVRTAKALGIVHGYPNGEFAPQKTMNRAELLKVFLKTSALPIPACTTSPYADTPNTRETYWYINFVCFSKAFNLMNETYNGTFSPDMPITRGDVAILFYRFHTRGLLAKSISDPIDR